MANSSKRKGNGFEREIVKQAEKFGLKAERAYASNGRALGFDEDVDCVIEDWTIQAKRRKVIADYLKPTGSAHIQVLRADREPAYAVLQLDDLLTLIKEVREK